jgi:hypothetical protein
VSASVGAPVGAAAGDPAGGPAPARVSYDYAVLRVVPRPHLGAWIPVGVVVHARAAEFLDLRVRADAAWLDGRLAAALGAAAAAAADAELLARYLAALAAVCRGDDAAARAGHAVALAPPSERFHWLTAPRSDVIQCSAVHCGVGREPGAALGLLYREYVGDDG